MKASQKTAQPKDVFTVVDWLHLGLGLKKGKAYRAQYLRQLCKGNKSKLGKLEKFMSDKTKLRPGGRLSLVAQGPRARWIVFHGLQDKDKAGSLTKNDLMKNKH